jgi:hypothetical protein
MSKVKTNYKNKEVHPSHFLSKYSLFAPRTTNGLKHDYPELNKEPAFKNLSKAQLLYVWYYACEASPFNNINDDRTRSKRSMEQAYVKNGELQIGGEQKRRLENIEFDTKLQDAINVMSQYRMGPRVKEKKMVDKMLANFEKIIDMDVDGPQFKDENSEIDFDKIKKYVDSSKSIVSTLPSLRKMAEGNSGLLESDGDDIESNFESGEFMDSIMSEEN